MGVPEQTIKYWRDEHNHDIPDTDGTIEEISENIKRDQAESVVSTLPPRKTARISYSTETQLITVQFVVLVVNSKIQLLIKVLS